MAALDPEVICNAVVDDYNLDPSALSRRYDLHLARSVAAWLCRRHTEAPLRELAVRLGLSRPQRPESDEADEGPPGKVSAYVT